VLTVLGMGRGKGNVGVGSRTLVQELTHGCPEQKSGLLPVLDGVVKS
jgi:hypothetical protein